MEQENVCRGSRSAMPYGPHLFPNSKFSASTLTKSIAGTIPYKCFSREERSFFCCAPCRQSSLLVEIACLWQWRNDDTSNDEAVDDDDDDYEMPNVKRINLISPPAAVGTTCSTMEVNRG